MELSTNRLKLRAFDKNDADDLYDYLSQKEVVKFEPYDVITRERANEEAIFRSENNNFIAVCLKDEGKVIGNLYINKIAPDKVNTYELGYVFNSFYHGKGYATEAVECILSYLFEKLEAHRVIAYCNTLNAPSWKLLERVGFRREATRVSNMYFEVDHEGNPEWFDSFQYALLARDLKKYTSK